jgi:hypothetical protein
MSSHERRHRSASVLLDGVRAAFRLDGLDGSGVWNPFPPLDAWMRGADLATLGGALVICGLCVRRTSRTEEMELRLWPATAAIAVVAGLAVVTRSWWSLALLLPLAVALRYAAGPAAPRWPWRRRAPVTGAALAVYAAALAPAVLSLQQHPLLGRPTQTAASSTRRRRPTSPPSAWSSRTSR